MNDLNKITIRNATPEDHEKVISVMPDWWDRRDLTSSVLNIFFIHFSDTIYIAEKGMTWQAFWWDLCRPPMSNPAHHL